MTGNARTAIITGASRGLGRGYAVALARAGWQVVLVARSRAELDDAAAEVTAAGGIARAEPADVTNAAAAAEITARAERDLGPVALLVNAAALGSPYGPFAETDPDEWWRTFEVNVRGPAVWCRAVLPAMLARAQGRIVNLVSGTGTLAVPYLSAYATSKTALMRLTETLAAEGRAGGISVFALEPGLVRTAMSLHVLDSEIARKWLPWVADYFAQGRAVSPELSTAMVLRIAAGEADALSGRVLTNGDDLAALGDRVAGGSDERLLRMRREPAKP